MPVRPFRPADAQALAYILHAAARSTAPAFYSLEQVFAWSPAPVSGERFLARVSDGRCVFVAVDQADDPVGFIELERNGHIDCFYCDPAIARTGIGSQLYAHAEAEAAEMGLASLHVEASEAALRFFEHRGFLLVGRQEWVRHGVPIHNYAMVKSIRRCS